MFVTAEVSKDDRSREVSDEQPLNMPPMSVTAEVSRPDRSRDASDEQPENMEEHVLTDTLGSMTADLMELLWDRQGYPQPVSSPEAPSPRGRTVRRPASSIFHSQVSHSFQPGVSPSLKVK